MRILLVVYDNDSYIHWFPQGLAYIAAVLQKEGFEVVVYSQDVNHYPDEHLTRYLDNNFFDAVGVSVIAGYYQYRKLLKISAAINNSKKRPFFIIGGHGPSPEPGFFLRKTGADAVVIGEGELTVLDLLKAKRGQKSLSEVEGIAFRESKEIIINRKRPLIKDIDTIPFPAYDLFPIEHYRLLRLPHIRSCNFALPVLSGRGCSFKCNFCYRMDEGFRPRSNQAIIDEIEFLKERYRISYIGFSDELLMSSVERTESLCKDFIKNNLDVHWDCNGRLNYARPDLLKLMKQAGCVFINYGIEAVDDQILKNMNKALTVKQIIKGIEETLGAGISPGFNIIFGNIGESIQTLRKGVEFLLKYDDGAQLRSIRPVTPYPGSPLYYYAIEKGLLKDCEDFYTNRHTNSDLVSVNFTDMSDEEFHKALYEANSTLIKNYFEKKRNAVIDEAKKLYLEGDTGFRGFRPV